MDALLPCLYFGQTIVGTRARFSADMAFELMQRHAVTHTFLFPTALKAMMKAHPDLMGELSYRNDITDGGKLSKQWRTLFTAYPDRFLLGSDCWVTERWAQYGEIMDYYQRWLAELPRDVGNKIAHRNAERIFGIKLN